ncbi:hypothetical protein [Anaeromicropila populeti]|uniref:Uncharacterized protein n=1 Tax=Anaeromicropila populeti TaxID=37658 RepID=A0A1I6J8W7_9FIRM|nr:hypothetical protein [Anaeromicropila populeti]SFR75404.1 hypothetical protein SAMN05661086_01465 [Anaeromicropila populeti]
MSERAEQILEAAKTGLVEAEYKSIESLRPKLLYNNIKKEILF